MNRHHLAAVAGTLALLVFTATLTSGVVHEPALPEVGHVAAHVVLFGGLAFLLVRGGVPPLLGLGLATGIGLGVELEQGFGGNSSAREATFDLVVDALAAMGGVALAAPARASVALGWWLHPALVLPIGLLGTLYAAERDAGRAATWAAIGTACFVPAGVAWVVGVRRGWFATADLVDRTARPPLFALGCASAAGFAAVAHGAPHVEPVANGLLALALALTAITVAGFKVSGHVATALGLAVIIAPWSVRGPGLFLAAAALLSWARVRAGVHRPVEVAGAWGLAGLAVALG